MILLHQSTGVGEANSKLPESQCKIRRKMYGVALSFDSQTENSFEGGEFAKVSRSTPRERFIRSCQ